MTEPRYSENIGTPGIWHGHGAESKVSSETRDAVNAGIVKDSDEMADAVLSGRSTAPTRRAVLRLAGRGAQGDDADAGDESADNIAGLSSVAFQRHPSMRSKMTAIAAEEMDEADETSGTRNAYEAGHDARSALNKARDRRVAKTAGEDAKAKAARNSAYKRRAWAKSREVAQEAQAAKTGAAAVKSGGIKAALASVASSVLPILGGITAAIIGFLIVVLLVSQLLSAIFGFWENEASKKAMEGLPPYITEEMVITALECQEKYGHPAGCTIAQIICESGCGDHLSGLATKDKNLFGIKWASSFSLCPEVTGYSSYSTQEEYGGQTVTIIANFTSFKSYEDCIVFRSRVLLANSRYADNPLIRRAIAEHDSDLMAEGLKDAGYATSSSYVESLKSVMETYNLYRFDGMTVKQYEDMGKQGSAVVAAAYTQLGVPYVWGGTSPFVGLDCSGLTQYCYRMAGISIPRNSEDQHAAGTSIPLSQAQPGDILWKSGHVAIYIGGDQYIHAPHTGDVVRIATGIDYFTCAVRF
jgi:hypothetical protein